MFSFLFLQQKLKMSITMASYYYICLLINIQEDCNLKRFRGKTHDFWVHRFGRWKKSITRTIRVQHFQCGYQSARSQRNLSPGIAQVRHKGVSLRAWRPDSLLNYSQVSFHVPTPVHGPQSGWAKVSRSNLPPQGSQLSTKSELIDSDCRLLAAESYLSIHL